jgi:hypothetical protein
MSDIATPADVFNRSPEAFLGKDMRAWATFVPRMCWLSSPIWTSARCEFTMRAAPGDAEQLQRLHQPEVRSVSIEADEFGIPRRRRLDCQASCESMGVPVCRGVDARRVAFGAGTAELTKCVHQCTRARFFSPNMMWAESQPQASC